MADNIVRDQNTNFVFEVASAPSVDGHLGPVEAKRVKVTLGGEREGRTAVLEGLRNGATIVSDGALLLNAALNNSTK